MKKLLLAILIVLMSVAVFAQGVSVSGFVKDKDGNVIVGATVSEKGVTNSTLTDVDGKFNLELRTSKKIVVSMAGYQVQEVIVGDDGKIDDIILEKKFKRFEVGVAAGGDYWSYDVNEYDFYASDSHLHVCRGSFWDATGGHAGLYMDFYFCKIFGLELGAYYHYIKTKGTFNYQEYAYSQEYDKVKVCDINYSVTGNVNYYEMPLAFKLRVNIKNSNIYALGGGMFGFQDMSCLKYKAIDGVSETNRENFGAVNWQKGIGFYTAFGCEFKRFGMKFSLSYVDGGFRKYVIAGSRDYKHFRYSLTYRFR